LAALAERCAIRAVMSRSGHNAQEVARSTGAAYGTTDFDAVLADAEVDAVLIATRHHLHADLALRALRAGKHVLVEKPLALEQGELDALRAFFDGAKQAPVLLTGHNRRFSPHAAALAAALQGRRQPLALDYRVNAGPLPADHWLYGPEGGGRNRGEATHMYDLFGFLTGSRCSGVRAQSGAGRGGLRRDDNFSVQAAFEDGSVATLLYTTLGSPAQSKERLECFWEGCSATLEDFRTLQLSAGAGLDSRAQEKGLREQWLAFFDGIRSGQHPTPLWQQFQAAQMALDVEAQLAGA